MKRRVLLFDAPTDVCAADTRRKDMRAMPRAVVRVPRAADMRK